MATQAKITLTALNGNIVPAERTLFLEPGSPTVPIGRASKSISKGLFSAVDNAWFDSPVMSREHAEIRMNAEDKRVTIQDIGSMHGTYLNDVELPRCVPLTVNNGDTVIFGAEVRRGPETFPACSFRVNFELTEMKTANTFAFPESSDLEDAEGEDYDFSEDENVGKQQSSEDGLSIESPSPKVPKISDAIDLTKDDSPGPSSSNRIDLTGETHPQTTVFNLLGHPVGTCSGIAPILVESEDEEAGFSSDSAELSEHGSGDSDNSDSCIMQEVLDASEDSEGELEDMAIDDVYDFGESVHDFSDAEPEDASGIDNIAHFAHVTKENPTILLSDIRTRTQFPESVADDENDDNDGNDDESEFGLSEAGEAGIRALFDDGLLQHKADSCSEHECEPEPENEPDVIVSNSSTEATEEVVAPEPTHASLPPLQLATEDTSLSPQQNAIGLTPGLSYPSLRQPSPSDAAMVKSAIPQQRFPTGVGEVGTLGKSTAQVLGEKTGKNAFFEAREINKAKFNEESKRPKFNLNPSTSATDARVATGTSSSPPFFKPARTSSFGNPQAPITSGSVSIRRVGFGFGCGLSKIPTLPEPAFPTREPCSFLDKPDQIPIPPRAPSPQLDMTSAYSFHVSKSSATAIPPTQNNSRGIKINDIIDTSTTSQRPLRLKRKAEEISDVTDKELRILAEASSASKIAKVATDNDTNDTQIAAQTAVPEPAPSNPTVSDSRPTKRLKKLLENVGYAALGGVAVGAGLFTVLVATAPDFL